MYRLYFGNEEKKDLIGKYDTIGEVRAMMQQKIKEINFTCYYMRYILRSEEGLTVVDYGSHVDFFYIYQ